MTTPLSASGTVAPANFVRSAYVLGLTPGRHGASANRVIEDGALIPAGFSAARAGIEVSNKPAAHVIPAQAAMKSIVNDARLRTHAEAIARAAKRLNDLR